MSLFDPDAVEQEAVVVVTLAPLSRRHWREAICSHLERSDPIHARWLQEHPRRADLWRKEHTMQRPPVRDVSATAAVGVQERQG
jgi:hypothetical protein